MYACLAVTCHLHFWQNDRDFLRATVVTRGWNGYRNKSQHRKSTLEKKILPPFQQGFEPATFQSRVRCSNHWAIPAPQRLYGRGTVAINWSYLLAAVLLLRRKASVCFPGEKKVHIINICTAFRNTRVHKPPALYLLSKTIFSWLSINLCNKPPIKDRSECPWWSLKASAYTKADLYVTRMSDCNSVSALETHKKTRWYDLIHAGG